MLIIYRAVLYQLWRTAFIDKSPASSQTKDTAEELVAASQLLESDKVVAASVETKNDATTDQTSDKVDSETPTVLEV